MDNELRDFQAGSGMLQVLAPHTAPIWVSAVRLLPAGLVLVAWAARQGRPQPQGYMAWVTISLFALADGTFFQVRFRGKSCTTTPITMHAHCTTHIAISVIRQAFSLSKLSLLGCARTTWGFSEDAHISRVSWRRVCRGPRQGWGA